VEVFVNICAGSGGRRAAPIMAEKKTEKIVKQKDLKL
jgi:hypothetical protein